MRTSAIYHPENSYFVIRRDWQLAACDRNECAAEILSLFEFHYNNRLANNLLGEIMNRAIRKHGKRLKEIGDWMPYSNTYLQKCLLNGRSQNVVIGALELLEKKGFISSDVPQDILKFYSTNMKWFRLMVDNLNAFTKNYQTSKNPIYGFKSQEPQVFEGDSEAKPSELTKTINTICEFHRHIHGKTSNYIYDAKRKNFVKARYKEKRTLAQCALAIIGNRFSDWHQLKHPRTKGDAKPYDSIEYMFRDAPSFERHLDYADAAGITEAMAIKELQAFLEGKVSQFAKKAPKVAQKASDEPETPVEPSEVKPYKLFALEIIGYFLSGTSVPEIKADCLRYKNLIELGDGLTKADILERALTGAAKTYRGEGIEESVAKAIKEFSVEFTTHQTLNGE